MALHWRILVNSLTNTAEHCTVDFISMAFASGGANKVSSLSASGTSFGAPASNALTNNGVYWWSQAWASPPVWLAAELSEDGYVVEVKIKASGAWTWEAPRSFDVQWSLDGSTGWTTAWSVADTTAWSTDEIKTFDAPHVGSVTATLDITAAAVGVLPVSATATASIGITAAATGDTGSTVLEETLTDTASVADATSRGMVYGVARNDLANMTDITTPLWRWIRIMSDTATLSESTPLQWYRVTLATDTVSVAVAIAVPMSYRPTATDIASLIGAGIAGWPVDTADSATFTDTAAAARAVAWLDALGLTEAVLMPVQFGKSIADALSLAISTSDFIGMLIADGVTLAGALTPVYRPKPIMSDSVTLTGAMTLGRVVVRTMEDALDLSDVATIGRILSGTLADTVAIAIAYTPTGSVVTWAINARTGATTEYDNFNYNSFATLRNRYLAASSAGLFALDGDTDNGSDIIARIKTGLMQFGGSRLTSFAAIYLGVNARGSIILRVRTGNGSEYHYNVVAQPMQTVKAKPGKGLRARYFSLELETVGQDFDLDTIEFVPVVANRRV